jgi:hypothetical protein
MKIPELWEMTFTSIQVYIYIYIYIYAHTHINVYFLRHIHTCLILDHRNRPRKMLVTDVPKKTKRRRKFHSNVRGTTIGCKLLAWSANTCQNQKNVLSDSLSLSLAMYYSCRWV